MRILSRKWKKNATAIMLMYVFLFPLVYNPVHYLFVDHLHSIEKFSHGFDSFHKTCELDDFNFNKPIDFKATTFFSFESVQAELTLKEVSETFLSYRNFAFLLRAPPLIT